MNIKKLMIGICLVTCMVGLVGCGASKDEVDVMEYLTVTFSGEDGNGKVKGGFNQLGLMEEPKLQKYERLILSMDVKFNKTENLKNGDKVIATITYDENSYNESDIAFKPLEKEFKVEGLIEYYSVDKTISRKEYKEMQEFIFEHAIKNAGVAPSEYNYNEDGTINNDGLTLKVTFDSMYIAEGCKGLPKSYYAPKSASTLAFYKVDYTVNPDFYYYDKLNTEQRSGSYYVWGELIDFSKNPETLERGYVQQYATEENIQLGRNYVHSKMKMDEGRLEKLAREEVIYLYMNKEEMLEFMGETRQGTYKEFKVEK